MKGKRRAKPARKRHFAAARQPRLSLFEQAGGEPPIVRIVEGNEVTQITPNHFVGRRLE